jgi:chemotaxis signal transduction protein
MTAIATHQESTPLPSSSPAQNTVPTSTLSDRFLLAQVQFFTLVIPALWVVEIFRVERSQILALPFYSPLLIGITHHGGRVLPLLSSSTLLNAPSTSLRENTMVVKLGDAAGSLAQVGIVIDRPLGSQSRAEIPSAVFADAVQSPHDSIVLLRPERVSADLWQPLCWIPSGL